MHANPAATLPTYVSLRKTLNLITLKSTVAKKSLNEDIKWEELL